jgi:hypothetical protein
MYIIYIAEDFDEKSAEKNIESCVEKKDSCFSQPLMVLCVQAFADSQQSAFLHREGKRQAARKRKGSL